MTAGGLVPYEDGLLAQGFTLLAGVDEVGRGCLAGPVVAAAVILEPGCSLPGVRDSKALTPARRRELDGLIRGRAVAVALDLVEAEVIDRVNIARATAAAMVGAVNGLDPRPQYLLVDGLPVPELPLPQWAIVGGDARCLSIAAASIVAKVFRDDLMERLHRRWPQYEFARHKGYGTVEHRAAIARHGPCPEHRATFRGVREHLPGNGGGHGP